MKIEQLLCFYKTTNIICVINYARLSYLFDVLFHLFLPKKANKPLMQITGYLRVCLLG